MSRDLPPPERAGADAQVTGGLAKTKVGFGRSFVGIHRHGLAAQDAHRRRLALGRSGQEDLKEFVRGIHASSFPNWIPYSRHRSAAASVLPSLASAVSWRNRSSRFGRPARLVARVVIGFLLMAGGSSFSRRPFAFSQASTKTRWLLAQPPRYELTNPVNRVNLAVNHPRRSRSFPPRLAGGVPRATVPRNYWAWLDRGLHGRIPPYWDVCPPSP